jgi:hypothetical protein
MKLHVCLTISFSSPGSPNINPTFTLMFNFLHSSINSLTSTIV